MFSRPAKVGIEVPITRIVCSDISRAHPTARIVKEKNEKKEKKEKNEEPWPNVVVSNN